MSDTAKPDPLYESISKIERDHSRFRQIVRGKIKKELRKPNGEFVIPGLLKLRSIKKPATKDRPGINPFTKQPITIKGKPAQKKVRATALKALKDLIQ